MEAPTNSLPDADAAWRPTQLQLIAFPSTPPITLQREWWRELTGQLPEKTRRKTQEQVEAGTFQGVTLSVMADVLRIVWQATPRLDPENLPESIPTLGAFGEARERFLQVMTQWIRERCPPIKRLSFTAKLLQFTTNQTESLGLLARYLRGVVTIDQSALDLLYRINRRRPATSVSLSGELPINRLGTWASAKITIQIQTETGDGQTSNAITREGHACALELDINTAQEFSGQLPHEKLPDLFTELAGMGAEIASRGDVP